MSLAEQLMQILIKYHLSHSQMLLLQQIMVAEASGKRVAILTEKVGLGVIEKVMAEMRPLLKINA